MKKIAMLLLLILTVVFLSACPHAKKIKDELDKKGGPGKHKKKYSKIIYSEPVLRPEIEKEA